MADDVDVGRLRAKRGGHRGIVTKYSKEAASLLETDTGTDTETKIRRLTTIKESLQNRLSQITKLDEDILEICETKDIEGEMEEADIVNTRIVETIEACDRSLKNCASTVTGEKQPPSSGKDTTLDKPAHTEADSTVERNTHEPTLPAETKSVEESRKKEETMEHTMSTVPKPKLPKLVLPRFKGDITTFQSFWDSFQSAVNNNPSLSNIDKFNYLKALLDGPAARCIQGLTLTSVNYDTALEILQDRFGKKQHIISAHMDDLLKLTPCSDSRPHHLRVIYDKIYVNVRGLEALGITASQYGSFLIPVVMSKLPAEVRLQVARMTAKEVWNIEDLLDIIKSEVEARELSEAIRTTELKPLDTHRKPILSTASTLLTANKSQPRLSCIYCKGEHFSASCEVVKDVAARTETLRKEGRCFLCLAKGHRVAQCTVSRRCRHCKRKHHQSICRGNDEDRVTDNSAEDTITTNTANPSNVAPKSRVFLQTARTQASATDNGDLVPVRILFDGGSERSYVTTELQRRLELKPLKKERLNLNTFGTEQSLRKDCDLVKIVLKDRDGLDIEIQALTFPTICVPPATMINPHLFEKLTKLDLADYPCTEGNDTIDVLIGSDYYWDIVSGEIIRGDGPTAVNSKLGWLLSGPAQGSTLCTTSLLTHVTPTQESDELVSSLQRFWETESLGIMESASEEQTFDKIIRFSSSEGRYVVSLPWVSLRLSSNNYTECLSRVNLLRSKLVRNEGLMREYEGTFSQQLEMGVIETVPQAELCIEPNFYLPHHGVVRQQKETTKLRIVFDGSAKTKSNLSLNDCLAKGPNHTPLVFHILLRFRSFCVALVADVEKAFHQISIEECDRDMLRFLWYKTGTSNPDLVHFRFCRVPFGLKSSPAILNSVIQKHLAGYKESHPDVSRILADSFYVDDFVGGVASLQQGEEVYRKAQRIMKEGGFNLRKWRTNLQDLQTIMTRESEQPSNHIVKVLGINWDTYSDSLGFDLEDTISYSSRLPPTKRSVLKLSAKIFDPLGFVSPFIIQLKTLFQRLCIDKCSWDHPMEGAVLGEWNQLMKELKALSCIKVPRYYFVPDKELITCQLHGFCDASTRAYAAVIYIRCFYSDGTVDVNIVSSKTRVAPIRGQTIPRLELLGAGILAKLMHSVHNALQRSLTDVRLFYWTDSYTTLCWIKNQKPWKQYVLQRVTEIHRLSGPASWKFCPGNLNPADLPSRGCKASALSSDDIWWKGPPFLKEPPDTWPDLPTSLDTSEADKELVKKAPVIVQSLVAISPSALTINVSSVMDVSRYGSMRKLLRVTAIVLKFIEKCKGICRSDQVELSAADLSRADMLWIKSIQASTFASELQALRQSGSGTPLNLQLNLFLDPEGVIRCQGRINNADVLNTSKTPILLPSHHQYTNLLIQQKHSEVHHNGIRDTLTAVRETHWIVKGRAAVKKVLRRCVTCKRYEGKPMTMPHSPQLPQDRVSSQAPFSMTGVDFAGPLYVQVAGQSVKTYVCLFTCGSTRALHLELTQDLTAESFLLAFRRFTGRRGLPLKIMSDNAKTFKASSQDVSKIKKSPQVKQYLTNRRVEWEFIVEKAPWWGGFWERLVRSVKNCIKKVVGRSTLNFEELRTLLVEVESTLNNRPLTYVYDDENHVSYPLTPASLIYGRRISQTVNESHAEVISTNQALTRRAKYHFQLLKQFNRQWSKEYLLSLRERPGAKTSNSSGSSVAVGDIVLIRNEGTPRCFWRLAEVSELIQSKDKLVRAVWLNVTTDGRKKKLRRPLKMITLLEADKQREAESVDTD